ncbi:hypothetical protein DPMN_155454, partial [Dreissena polymorpha]
LKDDDRDMFALTSFGLLKHGAISVNVTNMQFTEADDKIDEKTVGFSLDVGQSTGASVYIEDLQNGACVLDRQVLDSLNNGGDRKKNLTNIVVFRLDFKGRRVEVDRRGDDLQRLVVVDQTIDDFWNLKRLPVKAMNRREAQHDRLSDTFLLGSRRRRANEIRPQPKAAPKTDINMTSEATKASDVKSEDGKSATAAANATVAPAVVKADNVMVSNLNMTVNEGKVPTYSFFFTIAVVGDSEEGIYTLKFHNCKNTENKVSFVIDIIEVNGDNYLSAGMIPLPYLYFVLTALYFIIAVVWNVVLCKSKDPVYKIHYLMLSVVFVKSLSCLFSAMNYHFIQKEGIHENAWAVLFYIAYLSRGILLLITIILIGAGWAFIKHVLSKREKKLFLIVIPLQILSNIAWIIVEESEEGNSQYTTWKQIFVLIDLLCSGAILFPVFWSISHLQQAAMADGKAEFSLTKLKLFKHFYIMVVCYIYFTRIIVFLLRMTVPFKYEWMNELFREIATILFFVVTGYKFQPATDNPYLQVPSDDEDEEYEMDTVIVGQSGLLDTVKKVNQSGKEDGTGLKVRESSHEYD